MSGDDLFQRALREFRAETAERIDRLQELALGLETATGDDAVSDALDAAFREAHTIKGGAYALSLDGIGEVSHGLESLLDRMRTADDDHAPGVDALLVAVDVLRALMTPAVLDRGAPAGLCQEIAAALEGGRADRDWVARIVAASDPGDDVRDALEIEDATAAATEASGASRAAPDPSAPPPAPAGARAPAPTRESTPAAAAPATGPSASVTTTATAPEHAPLAPGVKRDEQTIRITARTVDGLINQVGELLINRIGQDATLEELAAIEQRLLGQHGHWRQTRTRMRGLDAPELLYEELESAYNFIAATAEAMAGTTARARTRVTNLSRATEGLQASIMDTRMLPARVLFDRFPRMVRDLSREVGVPVELRLEGEDCRIDWVVMDRIHGPLLHLIRNAIAHGLEAPDERTRLGKPATGTVTLRAFVHGSSVVVEVEDDGRGLDTEAIRRRAVETGILSADKAEALGVRETLDILFTTGFSTADRVSDLAGRGVGLDVVKQNLEELGGVIDLRSEPGAGSCFSLRVPLTLATFRGVVVRSRGELFAVPQTAINRVVRFRPGDIYTLEGKQSVDVNGGPMALATLADVLGLPELVTQPPPWCKALVVQSAEKRVALLVDDVVAEREMVIKSLGYYFRRVRHIAGATIDAVGRVVPILNMADCVRTVVESGTTGSGVASAPSETAERRKSILVVDDSITTRTLERNILEAEGYRVNVAIDGAEARDLLAKQTYDLVVSDVQMPRLDGIGLTRWIREESPARQLPVVLVSSLDSPADRKSGLEAGADAYLGKRSFSQEDLIETIRRLV